MSENVECKARLTDPRATLARALELGAVDAGTLVQRDTYFPVRHGRLKLREFDPDPADPADPAARAGHAGRVPGAGGAELIAYDRADGTEATLSTYIRAPANRDVGAALAAALGTRVVVSKRRRLLLFENVRIHLDEVEGLGSFLEFEAVLGPDDTRAEGEAKLADLQRRLGICAEHLVAVGYADLLEQRGRRRGGLGSRE